MDASSRVGRYEGDLHEDDFHGRGVFTSAQGGWTYSGALEQKRPTEGELVEADGRRFKVTHAKDCAFIHNDPKPKTKVGVVCEAAGMCGAGNCVGTLAVDMLRTACVWGE